MVFDSAWVNRGQPWRAGIHVLCFARSTREARGPERSDSDGRPSRDQTAMNNVNSFVAGGRWSAVAWTRKPGVPGIPDA